MSNMEKNREKGFEIHHHGVLKFLLKEINYNIEDAGYEDGVFWYSKVKR